LPAGDDPTEGAMRALKIFSDAAGIYQVFETAGARVVRA
jgi:hypothetical protein